MTQARLEGSIQRKSTNVITIAVAVAVFAFGAGGCVAHRTPQPRLTPSLPAAGDSDGAFAEDVSDGDGISLRAVEVSGDGAPARLVMDEALALAGTPYRAGGQTPVGFDCSGFTWYLYGLHGIDLPRRAGDQYAAGRGVESVTGIRPGDLVFFSTVGRGPTHVGLVVDNDRFIHAPSARGVVRVERLDASYWARRYVGARRLLPNNRPTTGR